MAMVNQLFSLTLDVACFVKRGIRGVAAIILAGVRVGAQGLDVPTTSQGQCDVGRSDPSLKIQMICDPNASLTSVINHAGGPVGLNRPYTGHLLLNTREGFPLTW